MCAQCPYTMRLNRSDYVPLQMMGNADVAVIMSGNWYARYREFSKNKSS